MNELMSRDKKALRQLILNYCLSCLCSGQTNSCSRLVCCCCLAPKFSFEFRFDAGHFASDSNVGGPRLAIPRNFGVNLRYYFDDTSLLYVGEEYRCWCNCELNVC